MKSMIKQKPWIRDYLLIFIGTALMSIALKSAFDTNGIVDGGFSGIAIIVKSVTEPLIPGGIPLGVTNLLLNIPVFFLGIKIMGFGFMAKTIWGTVSLSFWLTVIPVIPLVEGDMVLAVLIGGVMQGTGIGLVFLGRGTTGGTDLVASLIQRYVKHISIARIMQVIDGMIVVIGAFVFGPTKAMYAIVAIYVTTKVTDALMEGMNYAKSAFIITSQPDLVSNRLMKELDRGASGIHIKGMYTGEERMMVFCVVGKKQIPQLKQIVGAIDPDAFVVVSDAREVLGEGFQTDFS